MKTRLLIIICVALACASCTFSSSKDGSMFGAAGGSDIVEVLKVLHDK